jgi:D-xylose transport system ATP-binding protein
MNGEYLLELQGISKSFGGVKALQNVDLKLDYHEILAIVGDNGAGKSTLMKVISGALLPDSGKMFFEGQEVSIKNPQDSLALGIQMCYQDLALVDCLNIPNNLFLGREISKNILRFFEMLNIRTMRERSVHHLKNLGIVVANINEKVRNLSGGQRQVVSISRTVYWGTKLIILDEPTAALGVRESKKVLDLIKTLKEKDISVIIISHNLHHVFSVAERVLVLRQGRNAGDRVIKETDGDEVVKMITGAEFSGQELLD